MRKGDIGMEVRDLQKRLAGAGFKTEADGWYGPETEAAVRQFQRSVGLIEDGIAGPKTLAALASGKRDPRLLSQFAVAAAADRLGIAVASVLAVVEVESAGRGFLDDGRPVILYERHVMYRLLDEAGIDPGIYMRAHPNIVNRARGGYAGGALEYQRLGIALSIDKACAVQAASWGQFQIMGYNFPACGFASAEAFVAAMGESEISQLEAFVAFIEADPALHKALKARKWAEFAKAYNGPAYKENLYDTRLARAYDRHQALLADRTDDQESAA